MAAVPTFWDNPDTAQKTLQELNECKSSLETYQGWCEQLEDTKAIIELLELESDRTLLEEATDNLTHLQHGLDRWTSRSHIKERTLQDRLFTPSTEDLRHNGLVRLFAKGRVIHLNFE